MPKLLCAFNKEKALFTCFPHYGGFCDPVVLSCTYLPRHSFFRPQCSFMPVDDYKKTSRLKRFENPAQHGTGFTEMVIHVVEVNKIQGVLRKIRIFHSSQNRLHVLKFPLVRGLLQAFNLPLVDFLSVDNPLRSYDFGKNPRGPPAACAYVRNCAPRACAQVFAQSLE